MNMLETKKFKYFALSAIVGILMFLLSLGTFRPSVLFFMTISLVILVGSYYVHLPNSKLLTILVTSLLSLYLTLGVILTFVYFPNLSPIFKGLLSLGYSILFYVFLLVNNIFLVVDYRKEIIPLYRVSLTWSKISVMLVTIPFLAGIFKLSLGLFSQSAIVGVSSILVVIYMLWILKLSDNVKQYKMGELITMISLTFFITFTGSLSVSLIPTEAFLRSLFISSGVTFCVNYVEAHFRNQINLKLIGEHAIISFIFLLLLIIFTP